MNEGQRLVIDIKAHFIPESAQHLININANDEGNEYRSVNIRHTYDYYSPEGRLILVDRFKISFNRLIVAGKFRIGHMPTVAEILCTDD